MVKIKGIFSLQGLHRQRTTRIRHVAMFSSLNQPKRIVFLGTPEVAAESLQTLLKHSVVGKSNNHDKDGSNGNALATIDYEIVAVVTQPPAPFGRNKVITKSAVHVCALKNKVEHILTPEKAGDANFISQLQELKVDLCVTAAYGNYLPQKFLSLPSYGTVNIHPSLLPKYRGAAPVQRCLENGDTETGVSVLYSVKEMDAGPLLGQLRHTLDGNERALDLMSHLFAQGTQLLISSLLPRIFDGSMQQSTAQPQQHDQATQAPKISSSEASTDPHALTATQMFNKFRAFHKWPGVVVAFKFGNGTEQRLKLLDTRVLGPEDLPENYNQEQASRDWNVRLIKVGAAREEYLAIPCKDGTVLGAKEVHPETRKAMTARAYVNGLQGKPQLFV